MIDGVVISIGPGRFEMSYPPSNLHSYFECTLDNLPPDLIFQEDWIRQVSLNLCKWRLFIDLAYLGQLFASMIVVKIEGLLKDRKNIYILDVTISCTLQIVPAFFVSVAFIRFLEIYKFTNLGQLFRILF